MSKIARTPIDTWLLLIVLSLVGLGSVILFSASFSRAEVYFGDPLFFYNRNLFNLAVGLGLMLILSQIPYQFWLRFSLWVGVVVIIALLAVLHPSLSMEKLGSGRWLKHVPFQPSESVKLALAIILARYYARIGGLKSQYWHGFMVPCLLLILFAGLIVLEKDLGGPLVVFGVVFCMMLVAGVKKSHLMTFVTLIPVIVALIAYYKHRVSRILGWDNPWLYPRDEGYNIIHSYYAFAGGGVSGTGIGLGQQKHFFLPMPHTDYIFSVLGEELGLIGVIAVSVLFLLLASRGLSIAMSAKTSGGYYLAVGAVLTILVPALINMMVSLSIIPAKGLPLPFFSYGGSSLVVSLAAMGILLNVSGQTLKDGVKTRSEGAVRLDSAPMTVATYGR